MAEKKFLDFLDRFDGGGMGKSGEKFEGGGLLSTIANALATPYGSEDRMRDAMQAQRPMARPAGGFGNGAANSATPTPQQLSPLEMFGGQQPAPYSPPVQGSGMTPANNYVPPSDPFSYSGDREAGMAGDNYRLPDDANDFGINPNVGPNPFAGMPGVGGDGRSLDGEILRYTPTGLPEVSSELGFIMPDNSSIDSAAPMQNPHQSFIEELVEMVGADEAKERLDRGEYERLYNNYVKNGYTLNY